MLNGTNIEFSNNSQHGISFKLASVYGIAEAETITAFNNRKEYNITTSVKEIDGVKGGSIYGEDSNPYISLQPSVDKIMNDTGWKPKIIFEQSVMKY